MIWIIKLEFQIQRGIDGAMIKTQRVLKVGKQKSWLFWEEVLCPTINGNLGVPYSVDAHPLVPMRCGPIDLEVPMGILGQWAKLLTVG